jgi:SAM-dependent methyltransferase
VRREFEAKYHALEDGHWWFKGRRDYFLRLAARQGLARDAAILDVGCSSGPLLEALARQGFTNLHGIDASEAAIRACARRGLGNVHVMDAARPALPAASFDLLVASDVLEHVADDSAALSHWRALLKPGGLLAVFVPAFTFLWSGHDAANKHFRRYTRAQLIRSLVDAGLEPQFASYWNCALFAPAAAVRLLARLWPGSAVKDQLSRLPGPVNALLYALLRGENAALLARLSLPFGVSVMALARRAE